jgi:hypothetical protein
MVKPSARPFRQAGSRRYLLPVAGGSGHGKLVADAALSDGAEVAGAVEDVVAGAGAGACGAAEAAGAFA